MSAASDEARALLAAATQGEWTYTHEKPVLHARELHVPLNIPIRSARPHTVESEAGEFLAGACGGRQEADCELIARACSPAGGLLAALCDEVENYERGKVLQIKARQGSTVLSTLIAEIKRLTVKVEAAERKALETWPVEHVEPGAGWLVAEVARLWDELEAAKLVGHGIGQADGSIRMCGEGPCICGAEAHNARIDAALRRAPRRAESDLRDEGDADESVRVAISDRTKGYGGDWT